MRHWYTARDPEHLYPPVKPSLLKLDESIDKGEVKQSLWGKIKSCCHRVSKKDLDKKLNQILMNQKEEAAALVALKAQIQKATAEQQAASDALKKEVADLKAVIDAGGDVTPEVASALADVQAAVQTLDDTIPDAPPTP